MTVESPAAARSSAARSALDLFIVSALILFLELACIRWFPAHVLYLTFFTNVVLLACFLGMSVGCLTANRRQNFLVSTPFLLAASLGAGLLIEGNRRFFERSVDVGGQAAPQLVFFGTDTLQREIGGFVVPIEVLGGVFFLLLALIFLGPGQELGRALERLPNRAVAYAINLLGSVAGILVFAACSWWELSPLWWFGPCAIGLAYLLLIQQRLRSPIFIVLAVAALVAVPWLASRNTGTTEKNGMTEQHAWSPYYRIDYAPGPRLITTNLIGHQQMIPRDHPLPSYALPHLLHRDSGGKPFRRVLIIGAGSGNDLTRALQWGADHVDAVEIDPVIQRLGRDHHPDQPYADPRVHLHLNDGRNFLRTAPDASYDLVVYALVDSLVLHSGYSNIRLESYLFTDQAFADVRRCLKPNGVFAMYNFFRQGWIVTRLCDGVKHAFGADPLVLALPYRPVIASEALEAGSFTMLLAGSNEALESLRGAFKKQPEYWLSARDAPAPDTPNGFESPPTAERETWKALSPTERAKDLRWRFYGLAEVRPPAEPLRRADDDWPFLYLRQPMVPDLTLRGMAVMGGIGLLLILLFLPPRATGAAAGPRFDPRMFFLGAGFMLIETKAVVHMALLFGSTWMVNTFVFLAILLMSLLGNLFVLAYRPERLWPYYAGLLVTLGLNAIIPLDSFLGMAQAARVALSCALVFAPVFFAGVVFTVSFRRSVEPGRAFGVNVAGAMLGGLAENASMLIGFRYLVLLAAGLYALSALGGPKESGVKS